MDGGADTERSCENCISFQEKETTTFRQHPYNCMITNHDIGDFKAFARSCEYFKQKK